MKKLGELQLTPQTPSSVSLSTQMIRIGIDTGIGIGIHIKTGESLTPGQNSMCDLSGSIMDNYRGLLWQLSWGKTSHRVLYLRHSQCTAGVGGSCSHGLRPIWTGISAF